MRIRGFTLIALLLSILLPSLSAARQQAKSTLCLSNLRQLSHGWHMYADENNDVVLPGRFAKAPGGDRQPGQLVRHWQRAEVPAALGGDDGEARRHLRLRFSPDGL